MMCLINFQWQKHPRYPLIVAANRDEVYDRPTAVAHFWLDYPYILAGRDLLEKGTWLGMTKNGRFAALTNYRDPKTMYKTFEKSRGELVKNFLVSTLSPSQYLKEIHRDDQKYNGFNLLVGTVDELFYYNNIERKIVEVTPGTHSLSNHFLNTPWPKVIRGKQALQSITAQRETLTADDIFPILTDRKQAKDSHLPNTGIGLELERLLSPQFIQTDNYGTRSSTVLLVDHCGNVSFNERTYHKGSLQKQLSFHFPIKKRLGEFIRNVK